VSGFLLRDVRIFRPYPDEIPWELLRRDDAPDREYPESAQMRVAKLGAEVIGVYVLEPAETLRYRLLDLVVAPGYRGRGLGRWLLGHAIGLTESRGGRELLVRGQAPHRFFASIGFEPDGTDLKLVLTPE